MSTPHPSWHLYATQAIFETDVAHIWPFLADFAGLQSLVPRLITASTSEGDGIGMIRTLTLADGKTVTETLIGFHPEVYRLTYAMRDPAPMPWKHYFSTVQLQSLGAGQTHFSYTAYYQPTGTTDVHTSVFEAISHRLNTPFAIQK